MNANTIVSYQGGTGRNQILSQTLATATETLFLVGTDTGTATAILTVPSGGVTGASAPLDPNANSSITGNDYGRQYGRPNGTAAPWYSSTSFDLGRPFKVRIIGTGTAAANAGNTLIINLYAGTTVTSGNLVATTGAALATVSAAPLSFFVEAELEWSLALTSLTGSQTANLNYNGTQQYTVPKAAANVVTITTAAGLQFVASAKWGNAVGGTIAVTEFSIEQV
jgi:hypothetical protein